MALVTAAQVRAGCLRSLTGTAEDATLDLMISRCDSVMASFLGFEAATVGGDPTLEDVSYTLILDGPGGAELQLPYYPIQSVTSVHDSADRTYGSADLIAAGDYTLYGGEGIVRLDDDGGTGAWSTTRRGIQVVAVIGWSTIPDWLVHATCLQVAHWYTSRDHIGRTSISQGGGSISVLDLGLLPEVRQALNPHRLPASWVA